MLPKSSGKGARLLSFIIKQNPTLYRCPEIKIKEEELYTKTSKKIK